MNDRQRVIRAYLWHGYVPTTAEPTWFRSIAETAVEERIYTAQNAARLLDTVMNRVLSNARPPHILPLSGGWDSRILLGSLRERTDDIIAVTLGTPKQLDYQLGVRLAKPANVSHHTISTADITLDWAGLSTAAQRSPWTYLPDALFLQCLYQEGVAQGGQAGGTIWSGFLGEALTGGHYRREMSTETPMAAQERFAESQRRVSWEYQQNEDRGLPYAKRPYALTPLVNEREFLDLSVRQFACIAPIVLGCPWHGWTAYQGEFAEGVAMVAPFADAQWAAWWLHGPRVLHECQGLYLKMAELKFPDLFVLPSKYSWGWKPERRFLQCLTRAQHGVRNRLHRTFPSLPIRSGLMDNYMDFQRAFRKREDYRQVALTAFQVLKDCNAVPWIDLNKLWDEHDRGQRDHSQALQILIGLAINLDVHGEPEQHA